MSNNAKTLDEILAAIDSPTPSSTPTEAPPTASVATAHAKSNKSNKKTQSACSNPPCTTNAKEALDPKLAQALAGVAREKLVDNDKRQGRLRWLAFYYLSKRELSRYELAQKLRAKAFDDKAFTDDEITPLLDEFAQKGYQCDERFAQMVVREALRKQRGTRHIKAVLSQAKVSIDDLEEFIKTSQNETTANSCAPDGSMFDNTALDGTALDNDKSVDWLKLAVAARTKKYGDALPDTPKDKAKQLRFLQYRGFSADVCFDALKKTMADFE